MRKTIYTCDKCGKEFDDCNKLYPVAVAIGHQGKDNIFTGTNLTHKKDYCRNCLTQLFPGYLVSDNSPKLDRELTNITIGEKFEEIVR